MRCPFRMSMGRGGLGVRGRPRWSIQAEARPLQTGRVALSGAPDCACAGRRSATSGAGVRAERPASLSVPLRGNEAIKSMVLKVSLGSPACRGPVQGGTLPYPSGAWEGVRALADKPAHGYAGRRPAPAADAVGKAAALRSCGPAVLRSCGLAVLAHRMQGVHFLTKCQPLVNLTI